MKVSIRVVVIFLTNNTLVCHVVNINVSLFKHAENWIEQLTYNSHTSFAEYRIACLTEDLSAFQIFILFKHFQMSIEILIHCSSAISVFVAARLTHSFKKGIA